MLSRHQPIEPAAHPKVRADQPNGDKNQRPQECKPGCLSNASKERDGLRKSNDQQANDINDLKSLNISRELEKNKLEKSNIQVQKKSKKLQAQVDIYQKSPCKEW